MEGGDSESVTMVILDNSTGSFIQSSTSAADIYVNESTYVLGPLVSSSITRYITIYTQTTGNYSIRVQCQATDSNPTLANSTVNLEVTNDNVPPIISNIQVSNILARSATITWDTDENADSTVFYGTATPPTESIVNPTLVTSHSIQLVSLQPFTTYYFNVTSCDNSGNCATSNYDDFVTLDFDPANTVERGSCTAVIVEQGPNYRDGFVSKGDVVEFYCELPHTVSEREEVYVTVTNANKQINKNFQSPATIYGNQVVLYP
jgi:hypothetical protein